ncbi:MAG: MucB/RseB C-terminal domain-containing protein [Zoogloeaceae bacterium]|jgi:sigma-E factor negative regulatory protein RseB|nr:MucB/RseB C-terminal domain-containing protein [Zoogloeaceae bacterium]
MKHVLMLLALGGALAAPAYCDERGDAIAWLEKMATAAKKLNYTGTFTYRSYQGGGDAETSRITHFVDASGEFERLEVLDGSPREIIRSNDEVKCFLPDDKMVIVEKRGQYKAFPALLPASAGKLDAYYRMRLGDIERVAGLDSQLVILEPRDALRYGHHFWADIASGLLLKARMVDERNEIIEQFVFSQLQVNGAISKEALKPRFDTDSKTWRIHDAHSSQSLSAGSGWQFKVQLPGFRKSAGMQRQSGAVDGKRITHFVFTDGLAAISVFIEPLEGQPPALEQDAAMSSAGAINVYKRLAGNYMLTVLGAVPMDSLKRLGDGMEPRKK